VPSSARSSCFLFMDLSLASDAAQSNAAEVCLLSASPCSTNFHRIDVDGPSLTPNRTGVRIHERCRVHARLKSPFAASMDRAYNVNSVAHVVALLNCQNYKSLKFWSEWQDLNLRPLRPERVVSLWIS